MDFAARLKVYRTNAKLSQEQVAGNSTYRGRLSPSGKQGVGYRIWRI